VENKCSHIWEHLVVLRIFLRAMYAYNRFKDFYNRPIILSPEQLQDPAQVLQEFCSAFHLYEMRRVLAELMEVAITTSNETYHEPRDRKDIVFVCGKIEELIEAVYILNSHEK
jgi:hypothetical protein